MKGAWLGMLLIGLGVQAHAAGRIAEVRIIDRDFTSADNSYAGRTGRPANVGVIGVALFFFEHPRGGAFASGEHAE